MLGRGRFRSGQGRYRRFQFRLVVVVGDDVEALEERGAALSSFVTGVTNGRGVRRLGSPLARPGGPRGRLTTFMFGSSRIGGTRCGTRAPDLLLQKSTRGGRSGTRVLGGDLRHCEPSVGSKCAKVFEF
jgi:hypothetical protein